MSETPATPVSAAIADATLDTQRQVAVVEAPRVQLDPALTASTEPKAIVHTPAGAHVPAAPSDRAVIPTTIEGVEFTREQIDLIKTTIAKDATDAELELFLWTCKRLRLDPFGRQIYFIKRSSGDDSGGKEGRAQVSIDGFRLVAERTGEYQGQTPPEWARVTFVDGAPLIEWFPVWPFSDPPHSARVGIYRRGFREPMYGVARFDAYKVTKSGGALNRMWSKMGPEMLAKCAEALGLRKAFPQELSGVYTTDEMGQAYSEDDDTPRDRAPTRQSGRRDSSSTGTSTRTSTPAESSKPETPPNFTNGTGVVFPYGPLKKSGVTLDAVYNAGVSRKVKGKAGAPDTVEDMSGRYVVSDRRLTEEAIPWVTGKLKKHQALETAGESGGDGWLDQADIEKLIAWADDLRDEVKRRAELLNTAAQSEAAREFAATGEEPPGNARAASASGTPAPAATDGKATPITTRATTPTTGSSTGGSEPASLRQAGELKPPAGPPARKQQRRDDDDLPF